MNSFAPPATSTLRPRRIDIHVHVVGNGSGGTGCWYRPRGWTRWAEPFMLRGFGLGRRDIHGDLDRLYADRLRRFIRTSSLDAAVILAQDYPYDSTGRRLDAAGSFHVPNDYVLGLARAHPEFLAGVSIHPARSDALVELERCLAGGAALLKCLPNCQNIDWAQPAYTRFLERMAEAGLPLLAHTGSEHTLPVLDARLADPRILIRPLEIGVTCIAAHCGTASGPFDRDYFETFLQLLARFPNLYGDNSAFAAPVRQLSGARLDQCLNPEIAGRILHGSDVPVPVSGLPALLRGAISRRAYVQSRREANPLERDYLLKRALGFPEASFTGAANLLRRPAPVSFQP
jgi:predicted TIM-barrel fold metal-dependent hydrolase